MFKRYVITFSIVLALVVFLALSIGFNTQKEFSFGLDLEGGARLVYIADTSDVPTEEVGERLEALKGVIERRVNAFGVSEPSVYTETSSIFGGVSENRLVVELPGITDISAAIEQIGKTPLLEFMIYDRTLNEYQRTNINGAHIVSSSVGFLHGPSGAISGEPAVILNFNGEGSKNFGDLTKENTGEILGIFLDGVPISEPVINEPILGGTTQITGAFTIEEAQELSGNLNFGALPLPIELGQTQTIDAVLGESTIEFSVQAGIIALLIITLFFIAIYRLSGIVAVLALVSYIAVMFSIFKAFPVVLTAAGLAGFIMSIGFAVDANVLIFERMREELKFGKSPFNAVIEGTRRAWNSIRDANISSLIIAVLLFWFGSSLVKGFALTFGVGIVVSMLTAILFTQSLLGILMYKIKKNNKLLV